MLHEVSVAPFPLIENEIMLSNPGEPEQCVGFTLVLTHFCKKHSPEKWGFHFVADKGVAPSQTGGFLPVVLCHITQGNEDLGWKRPAKAKGMSTLAMGSVAQCRQQVYPGAGEPLTAYVACNRRVPAAKCCRTSGGKKALEKSKLRSGR